METPAIPQNWPRLRELSKPREAIVVDAFDVTRDPARKDSPVNGTSATVFRLMSDS